jgi:hypothetical protein
VKEKDVSTRSEHCGGPANVSVSGEGERGLEEGSGKRDSNAMALLGSQRFPYGLIAAAGSDQSLKRLKHSVDSRVTLK